ncbi:MAG: acyl-CoA dehydrogenase family protein [Hyphomicrobiaceae bacterium]
MAFDAATRARVLATVDRLIAERIAPRARAVDADDVFPRDLWQAMSEAGLFGLGIAEEYGGLGRDLLTPLLISERIARASGAVALTFNNSTDSVVPIAEAAQPALKARLLPRLAGGELIPCISISEPGGGSDVGAIRTTARRDGDVYRLDGRKMWCTNGNVGDVFTVFAKTDLEAGSRGLTAFVVEAGMAGFARGPAEPLIGLRGSPVAELTFENVAVPIGNRLGEEGEGFRIAMLTLNESRLHCAATALGVARAALDLAMSHARDRKQFGKPLFEHQGMMFHLADLATALAAARALWKTTARRLESENTRAVGTEAAMTKLHCANVAMRIVTEAVEVMGASGLTRALDAERLMRDAKAFQIYDGASLVQKSNIGRDLYRNGLPFDFLDP